MAEKENTQGPGTFIILNHRRNVKTNWGKHQYLPYHHSEHTVGVYPQSANIKPFFKKQLTDIMRQARHKKKKNYYSNTTKSWSSCLTLFE